MVIAKTCDYAGNGGFIDDHPRFVEIGDPPHALPDSHKLGYIPLRFNLEDIRDFPFPMELPPHLHSGKVRVSSVRDGLSNTIALWESAGTKHYWRDGNSTEEQSWKYWMYSTNPSLCFNEDRPIWIKEHSHAVHGYYAAWAGYNRFRARAWANDGLTWGSPFLEPDKFHRHVNATNSYRSPFSFHPSICMTARADGSIHSLNENISRDVFIALVSRAGGD